MNHEDHGKATFGGSKCKEERQEHVADACSKPRFLIVQLSFLRSVLAMHFLQILAHVDGKRKFCLKHTQLFLKQKQTKPSGVY